MTNMTNMFQEAEEDTNKLLNEFLKNTNRGMKSMHNMKMEVNKENYWRKITKMLEMESIN